MSLKRRILGEPAHRGPKDAYTKVCDNPLHPTRSAEAVVQGETQDVL